MLQATRRVAAVACVLTLALAPQVRAQRPAGAFLDLPAQVPDYGAFLRYGRGSLPILGTLNSFGAEVQAGFGAAAGSPYKRNLAGAGGALFSGTGSDGAGWGLNALLGRQFRAPFPGNFGVGLSTRLAGAYTHIPAATGRLNELDASLALGAGSYMPTPFGNLELWLMPRAQLRHTDASLAGSSVQGTSVGPGASFGLAFFTRAAVAAGVNVGGDVVSLEDPGSHRRRARWAVGVQLHLLR